MNWTEFRYSTAGVLASALGGSVGVLAGAFVGCCVCSHVGGGVRVGRCFGLGVFVWWCVVFVGWLVCWHLGVLGGVLVSVSGGVFIVWQACWCVGVWVGVGVCELAGALGCVFMLA